MSEDNDKDEMRNQDAAQMLAGMHNAISALTRSAATTSEGYGRALVMKEREVQDLRRELHFERGKHRETLLRAIAAEEAAKRLQEIVDSWSAASSSTRVDEQPPAPAPMKKRGARGSR